MVSNARISEKHTSSIQPQLWEGQGQSPLAYPSHPVVGNTAAREILKHF